MRGAGGIGEELDLLSESMGNNGLWYGLWCVFFVGLVRIKVLFLFCRESGKASMSPEGPPLDEGNVIIFVMHVLCSLPTSRRGIRLKANVASCCFSHRDHGQLATTPNYQRP